MSHSVQTTERAYILTFDYAETGRYVLSSHETQRLIDEYPVLRATENLVILRSDQPDHIRAFLAPATLGGSPAFILTDPPRDHANERGETAVEAYVDVLFGVKPGRIDWVD